MRTELFMHFCFKKYIGTQGEVCRQLKLFYPPVVYVTGRSKAVVSVFFLFCVALWFIYYGALHVFKSSRALCPRFSSFLLAL